MKSLLGNTFASRSLYTLLILALATAAAFGQGNLVVGSTGTPTFVGTGTYTLKGNIVNTGVSTATTIGAAGATVTMGGAAAQSIGGGTGAINFQTLNITPSAVATTTLNVASTVNTALTIGQTLTAATLAIVNNNLTIGGTSALVNGSSALTTGASSLVTYSSASTGQVVLGGFTYSGNLTLSGGGTATKTISTATTVSGAFDASAAGALTVSGNLTLGSTGTFASVTNSATIKNGTGLMQFGAVTNTGTIDGTVAGGALTFNSTVGNNSGTIKGGAALATFSGLLTQTGTGILTSGAGGLTLTAGLTNTLGNITVSASQAMAVSGAQFTSAGGSLSFDPASTVTYGASATTIVPATYGTLTMNTDAKSFPAGTTTVNTTINANSDMSITGTLAMGATANANIKGAFTDNGTFTPASGAGVVAFSGTSAQAISGTTATIGFANLTISGTGDVTSSSNNLTVSGALVMSNENLVVGSGKSLAMTGTTQPNYNSSLYEVKGNMIWSIPASSTSTYTFNNSATTLALTTGPSGAITFGINSTPGANGNSSYSSAHTINRTTLVSYSAAFGTGTLQIGYLSGETGTSTEANMKEFNNTVTSAVKLGETGRASAVSGTSFGYVNVAGLTSALFASGNQILLDDRFNLFKSIVAGSWTAPATWNSSGSALPTNFDDVEIAGSYAVTIPTATAAAANSVLIDQGTGVLGGLTLNGTATLAVGVNGLTNNNTTGTGLTVNIGTSVTVAGANLTNNGTVTNNGSITVN